MNIIPAAPQSEWARDLVLLAKNTFIWLDQLSHKYYKRIKRLDQIPDAEIAEIASRGFTGLWLVGIWQRRHPPRARSNRSAVAATRSLRRIPSANIARRMRWGAKKPSPA